MSNPLQLVYAATIQLMKDTPAVSSVLRDSNIIDWSTRRNAVKDVLTHSDQPEVNLKVSDIAVRPGATSNMTDLAFTLSLEMLTDDRNLDDRFLPLCFGLVQLAHRIRYGDAMRLLEWEGYKFVRDITVTGAPIGQADPVTARGAAGWSTVWSLEFALNIPETLLEAYTNG